MGREVLKVVVTNGVTLGLETIGTEAPAGAMGEVHAEMVADLRDEILVNQDKMLVGHIFQQADFCQTTKKILVKEAWI